MRPDIKDVPRYVVEVSRSIDEYDEIVVDNHWLYMSSIYIGDQIVWLRTIPRTFREVYLFQLIIINKSYYERWIVLCSLFTLSSIDTN